TRPRERRRRSRRDRPARDRRRAVPARRQRGSRAPPRPARGGTRAARPLPRGPPRRPLARGQLPRDRGALRGVRVRTVTARPLERRIERTAPPAVGGGPARRRRVATSTVLGEPSWPRAQRAPTIPAHGGCSARD